MTEGCAGTGDFGVVGDPGRYSGKELSVNFGVVWF